jgi:uncharacterized membrane protein YjjB (DUF3815 family)
VAAISALSLHEPIETAVVAFCPCTVLVPGSHLLNGAIDLVRTRIALGVARLTYAGIIVLMICFGLLLGFAAGGAPFPAAGPSTPVPLLADVIAAGCAVASFGTFFSMPWRMLPFPMGADLARGGECRDRSARGLRPRQHHRHTGRRPPASTLRRARLFRSGLNDAGFLSIPGSECLRRTGLKWTECTCNLLTNFAANGATAFLVIGAMTFGLILPRMLLEGRS